MEHAPADPPSRDHDRLRVLLATAFQQMPLRSHPRSRVQPTNTPGVDPPQWTAQHTAASLDGCPFDVHLGLKFYHADPLPRIVAGCADAGSQFVDHEFPVHPAATVSVAGRTGLAAGIITSENVCDILGSDGMLPPQQNLPPMPPAGASIHVTSMVTGKNLRLKQDGTVDCSGGNGKWAKFVVTPNNGFLRLHAQQGTGGYIAVGQNGIRSGQGGRACELALVLAGPGVFSIAHAHAHGQIAFNPDGNPAFGAIPTDPRGHFRYSMACNERRRERVPRFVEHAAGSWRWVRGLSQVTPAGDRSAVFSSPASISPRNINQGQVGNCGFCSGFASLAAAFPKLVATAFGFGRANDAALDERTAAQCGAIVVRLFPGGIERFLLLDDYVVGHAHRTTVSPSQNSCFEADLWVRLLEKAFVKVQSSYASLDGYYKYNSLYRHPGRALQLLTGAPLAFEMHYKSGPGAGPATGALVNDTFVALVASQDVCVRVAHCRVRADGLVSNHGYSLLWVGEAAGVRLACLRNPWGRGSYTGPYGYGRSAWSEATPEVKASLLGMPYFSPHPATGRPRWRGDAELPNPRSATTRGPNPRSSADGSPERLIAADLDDGVFLMAFDVFFRAFPVTTIVGPVTNGAGRPQVDVPDVLNQMMPANIKLVPELLGLLRADDADHDHDGIAAVAAQDASPRQDREKRRRLSPGPPAR